MSTNEKSPVQKIQGPEVHPLKGRLLLKQTLEKAFRDFKKQPNYDTYHTVSQTSEKYFLSLMIVTYKDSPQAKKEVQQINNLQEKFFNTELLTSLKSAIEVCIHQLSRNTKPENIIAVHGILCHILQDCQSFQDVMNIPEKKAEILQLRVQILELLRKNHEILGQKKEVSDYGLIISATKNTLAELKMEIKK